MVVFVVVVFVVVVFVVVAFVVVILVVVVVVAVVFVNHFFLVILSSTRSLHSIPFAPDATPPIGKIQHPEKLL